MVVLCYWSVDKMVSYLIGGVMVSILALSVLDQVRTKTGRLGIGILISVPEWSDMSSHSLVFFIRHQQFY